MAGIDKTYINTYSQYREIADWCKKQGTIIDSFGNKITPYDYIPHIWEYSEDYISNPKSKPVDIGEYTEEYINKRLNDIRKDNQKYKTEEIWKEHLKLWSDNSEYIEKNSTFEKYCNNLDDSAEIVLWNTDHVFDIYLIKNCPIKFIQDRLKEQYGGGWSKESFTGNDNSYEAIKNGMSVYDIYKRNGISNPHFKIKYRINVPFKDDDIEWWIDVYVDGHMWDYDSVADYWYGYNECYYPKGNGWNSSSCQKFKGNMNPHRIRRILSKWILPEGAEVRFSGDYRRHILKEFTVIVKK